MRKPFPLTLLLLTAASAQTRRPTTPKPPTTLPVTRVALYKNGVGFFEHAGRVLNDQSITIDFTSAQLNDVLQSLTAVDLNGGRIAGATYNSTTPLDQQLKSLPLALGPDASTLDFYSAIRGARVSIHSPAGSITGRLLSIEARTAAPVKDPDAPPTAERFFITVVSDSGTVRTLELTPTTEVHLLDSALGTDVTRYLELLASTRSAGLRHLTLQDRGTGPRDLHVSYISEVPVWKSTYRILFTDPKTPTPTGTATLQGWSVVDNTTGSDWLNVHLSLIAGAPQSFIQPLSTPYYTRRPEIPLPAEAQLAPQTHESGDTSGPPAIMGVILDQSGATINNASIVATNVTTGARTSGTSTGDGSFSVSLPEAGQYRVAVSSPGFQQTIQNLAVNSGARALNFTLNVGSVSEAVEVSSAYAAPMAKPMAARQMQGRGIGYGAGSGMSAGSPGGVMGGTIENELYQDLAAKSITPGTTTAAFDDFFQYTLTDPITIRKNESALVPILQTQLPVERVTLWSQRQPSALRALWITNSSTLTLDRGSFSIVENGNFGGEGLLDPIHPGERRLLSYAADQAVRVSISNSKFDRRITRLRISKGVLTQTSTDVSDLTYDVRNASPDPRNVLIEHPVRPGYTLDPATPKPDETTPAVYRFKVAAAPSQTAHLHISERHTNFESIRLVDRTEDQLILLLRNSKASPAALAALQPVFDAHHAVTALDDQISTREQEINRITVDQNRLRENLKALKGTPEEKALATRYTGELNAQEDRLSTLHSELEALHTQRTAADLDFQNRLAAVDLDETL